VAERWHHVGLVSVISKIGVPVETIKMKGVLCPVKIVVAAKIIAEGTLISVLKRSAFIGANTSFFLV
jgi:hypothetical protein